MPDCSGDDAFGVYLRGVFLVCGLVANPEKGYQLELFLHDESKCRALLSIIEEHGMGGKAVKSQRQQLSLYQRERKDLRYADLYGRYDAGNGDNERKNL